MVLVLHYIYIERDVEWVYKSTCNAKSLSANTIHRRRQFKSLFQCYFTPAIAGAGYH